jgi:hypothetical protein
MKTAVLLSVSVASLALLACQPARAAASACEGVLAAPVKVEAGSRWEESRLSERTPKAPKLEGVRLSIRPDVGLTRAGLERALRCGAGSLGEALSREGARDIEVREAVGAYEVRARVASEEAVGRLLESAAR